MIVIGFGVKLGDIFDELEGKIEVFGANLYYFLKFGDDNKMMDLTLNHGFFTLSYIFILDCIL